MQSVRQPVTFAPREKNRLGSSESRLIGERRAARYRSFLPCRTVIVEPSRALESKNRDRGLPAVRAHSISRAEMIPGSDIGYAFAIGDRIRAENLTRVSAE